MMEGMAEAPSAPPLDDETAAALTRFNAYVEADRERQRREKALAKAERVKDEAAAAVRNLNSSRASADEKAAAETAYREAADALKRLRDGTGEDQPTTDNDSQDEQGEEGDLKAAAEEGEQGEDEDLKAVTEEGEQAVEASD